MTLLSKKRMISRRIQLYFLLPECPQRPKGRWWPTPFCLYVTASHFTRKVKLILIHMPRCLWHEKRTKIHSSQPFYTCHTTSELYTYKTQSIPFCHILLTPISFKGQQKYVHLATCLRGQLTRHILDKDKELKRPFLDFLPSLLFKWRSVLQI